MMSGCSSKRAAEYTLYRNSGMNPAARVHWATFNAAESDRAFNLNNCQMTARLLNANVRQLNQGRSPIGFWCEPGNYREDGGVPNTFQSEFPTDT
jgi:hypothetical protein